MTKPGRESVQLVVASLFGLAAGFLLGRSAYASSDIHVFDIPAQGTGMALREFAYQTGRQIVAPGDKLREIKSPALHGSMSVAAALEILLKNSGLSVVSDNGSVIVLAVTYADSSTAADRFASLPFSEKITVTGYRASLASSTHAKRNAVGFEDSVFAEDMGKFPDTNIAEAFNRIPGITISREIDGSGMNVSVRGLGPSFTKVLLNGAQVAVASTGPTNASNANREVDLNIFPVELFTQLVVLKSARADRLEGGTAGTVDMRSIRPFDNPGLHVSYSLKAVDYGSQGAPGSNGALLFSNTFGPFGVLLGATNLESRFFTRGYETAGWTTPHLSTDGLVPQCGPAQSCNTVGGGGWAIPAVVPDNVTTAGLVPGQILDQAKLLALNPGLSLAQLNNMLLPRLGRYFMEKGVRSRYNGTAAFEYWPSNAFHFYVDVIGARLSNNFDRSDINWMVRNGGVIPIGVVVDADNVVNRGLFANAQWFLEARPYHERGDFIGVDPGFELRPSDRWRVSLQANASRSHYLRDSPTILLMTAPSAGNATGIPGVVAPQGGAYVEYTNNGAGTPLLGTNIDLNEPANFQWAGGRVNVTAEKRYVSTSGAHLNVVYGDDDLNITSGFAYDQAYRSIQGYDNSPAWQSAVCGDGPSISLPLPNSQPPCQGLSLVGSATVVNAAVPGSDYPSYPGLGSGYGAGALKYLGSLIPQSSLASYLRKGPAGFVTVDYSRFLKDAHYSEFSYPHALTATGTNLGVGSGVIDEKNYGLFAELNGIWEIANQPLRFNIGLRAVRTFQTIAGPVSHFDSRNATTACVSAPGGNCPSLDPREDGGFYPNYSTITTLKRSYDSWLPAANFVYDISDVAQLRLSLSRSMTRPDPSSMLPGMTFSDQSAVSAIAGNGNLKPYYSSNIDLGANLFTGDEGYVGFGLFRKEVSGFTYTSIMVAPFSSLAAYGIYYSTLAPSQQAAVDARGGPEKALVQVSQAKNGEGVLAIDGLELSVVQPLEALLRLSDFGGFGVNANVTIVNQHSGAQIRTVATGVASFTYNISVYYEKNGVSLRTSYVFNDRFAFADTNQNGVCLPNLASVTCPNGARLYTRPYAQLDVSSSFKLSRLFGPLPSDPELVLDVQNLTHSTQRHYFQFSSAPYASYAPGAIYIFGLRGKF